MLVLRLLVADSEDDRGGGGVYISASPVGFHHAFVPAVECTDTQFDLGEV